MAEAPPSGPSGRPPARRSPPSDPARGRFRSYRIDAGTDLFGDWLVNVTYGRIGSRGRLGRHVAASKAEARKIVRHRL